MSLYNHSIIISLSLIMMSFIIIYMNLDLFISNSFEEKEEKENSFKVDKEGIDIKYNFSINLSDNATKVLLVIAMIVLCFIPIFNALISLIIFFNFFFQIKSRSQ